MGSSAYYKIPRRAVFGAALVAAAFWPQGCGGDRTTSVDAVAPPLPAGWSVGLGGTGSETVAGLALDASGSVVVAGTFDEVLAFGGKTQITAGGEDLFVAKLSPSGGARWVKSFGSTASDRMSAVAVAADGGIVIAGTLREAVDFGGGPVKGGGGSDIFVVKLAPDGSHLWSRALGGAGLDGNPRLAIDPAGDVLIAGEFSETIELGGAPLASVGRTDVFVGRLRGTDGAPIAGASFGGSGVDTVSGLALAAPGALPVLAGAFPGSFSVPPAPLVSLGEDDAFVTRLATTLR